MPKNSQPANSASDGKSRIPKACEECRRRKQKCNGLTPCNVCTRRGSECSYRSFLRNRASRALLAQRRSQQQSPQTPAAGPGHAAAQPLERETTGSDDAMQPVPLRERIFNNVRASYAAPESPSCLFQLYYGPSSNFSFLQHIHSHLTARRASQQINQDNDGDEGISRFKYKGIVFGSATNKNPAASPVFLRHSLAQSFLQNYLSTTHHFMPLLDPAHLRATLEQLYTAPPPRPKDDHAPIPPLDRAAVVIALAMGAVATEEEAWRELLLTQARAEADAVRYHVNERAVQVALLLAHCEYSTGHPNLAYLALGSAVTKALAAGLHRKEERSSRRPPDQAGHPHQTMWNLFCNESISCLASGRPYLLARETVTAPLPARGSFMAALVQLCMAVRRTHRMYFDPAASSTTTIGGMVDAANAIRHELDGSVAAALHAAVGLRVGHAPAPAMRGESLTRHIVTTYLFHYTTLLATRPLLLLHIDLSRHHPPAPAPDALLALRAHCIAAARATVAFAETLLATVPGAQGHCNHGYFLESACFVLVLAAAAAATATGTGTGTGDDAARGLGALRALVQRRPVPSVVAALERMVERIGVRAGEEDGEEEEEEEGMLVGGERRVEQSGGGEDGDAFWTSAGQDVLSGAADGAGEGLLEDLELPSMDWGIDFSVLDAEEFVSVMGIQGGFGGFQ